MTQGEYLGRKNRYVDIPIAAISAIPNYVAGSQNFRLYFSYDDTTEYKYPGDLPVGQNRKEIAKVLYGAPPSLKTEWLPTANSSVALSNGATFVRKADDSAITSPISATPYRVEMYPPNSSTPVGTTTVQFRGFYNMGPYDDDSGGYYNPPETSGVWVFARMNYDTYNQFLSDLANTGVSYNTSMLFSVFPYKKTLFGSVTNYFVSTSNLNAYVPYNSSGKTRELAFFTGLTYNPGELVSGFTGDTSKPQGGDGDYDNLTTTDDIPIHNPTSLSGVASLGGIKTHKLDSAGLNNFHDFMFSDAFNNKWDSIRKSFGSPQECIVGFRAIYATVPDTGNSTSIYLGNISTEVSGLVVTKDYIQIDCGSISVPEIWGNFLDYDPYTNINLYLPYCSTVQLPANEVVGGTLSVKYNVDILTGACVAEVYSTKTDKYGTSSGVIMRVTGNCAIQIPWSMVDATRQWQAIMSTVTTAAATAVTAGASLAAGVAASEVLSSNNVVGSAASTLGNVPAIAHQNVIRGGNASSNVGALQHPKPYLTITRPIQSFAENYGHYYGFPSNITKKLSALTGFTKVAHINLENIPATSEELILIQQALQSGVIL